MKFHSAPLAEDCVAGPSRQQEGVVSDGEETVGQTSSLRGEARQPRAQRENVRHKNHPFLTLQQDSFNKLERELGTLQSMRNVNSLKPLGDFAAVPRTCALPATSTAITPPSSRSLSTHIHVHAALFCSFTLPSPVPLWCFPHASLKRKNIK